MNAAGGRPLRIGLYGGSFDPVHVGHLALARSALDDLALDQLRFVPAGRPWQKPGLVAAADHRSAMLELAIADDGFGDPRYRIERCELLRDGPSYTIDTVEQLQRREPGQHWFLLIGQDQHARLQTWHRWRELLGRVRVAVAVREGDAAAVAAEVLAFGYERLQMPPVALSSTQLRRRVAAGLPIADLVAPAVARYIDFHRLYRDGAG